MKTIIVDDEEWARKQLEAELEKEDDIELVGCFEDSEEAYICAKSHRIEFALLDVKMPGMNGIELGAELRRLHPNVIIIYISSYPEYFSDAYRNVRADYYMLKPYRKEDLEDVLERARLLSKRQRKRIQFRTFGRFDMFVDGQPVKFRNAKAKELLAICVDREGGLVKMEEAIDKLWEDSPMSSNVKVRYRKAVAYLHTLLAEYRVPDIFTSGYGSCHIVREKVACDYYEFLEADENNKPQFFGEYMHEYSWGEETAARLAMQMQNHKF